MTRQGVEIMGFLVGEFELRSKQKVIPSVGIVAKENAIIERNHKQKPETTFAASGIEESV
jgi:hypothetical protein